MESKEVLIISTQEEDWSAIYVENMLVSQGHSVQPLELLRLAEEYEFTSKQIRTVVASDEDEVIAESAGNFPQLRNGLITVY